MTKIKVGEGANAKTVNVSDEFSTLTPEQQQATANDIAKQLGINTNPVPSADVSEGKQWRRGTIAPVEKEVNVDEKGKMTDTGEWRFAVPGMITETIASIERLMQPPPVMDPNNPDAVMGVEGLEQVKPGFSEDLTSTAMLGLSGIGGAGKAAKVAKPAPGAVVSETVETIGKGKTTGGTFREGLPEVPEIAPAAEGGGIKQTWTPDMVDQELDALLIRMNEQKAKRIPGKPENKFRHQLGDKPEVLPERMLPVKEQPSGIKNFSMQQERILQGTETGALTIEGSLGTPVGKISVPGSGKLGTETVPLALSNKQAARFQTAAAYAQKQQTKEAVANFNTQMENTLTLGGNKLTPVAKEALEMSKQVIAEGVDDLDGLFMMTNKLVEAAEKTPKSGWMDKFLEVWINWGLLSGLQTHVSNVLSNTAVNMWGITEPFLAATAGKVTRSGITYREAMSRAYGDLEAVGDALFAAGKSFKSEKPLFEGADVLDYNPTAIGGSFGKKVRIPGRALTAEDAFFKTLAYRQEINGLSVRKAIGEGHQKQALTNRIAELRAKPTDDMTASAEQFAKKQTFTDGLGKYGRMTQTFLKEKPWARLIVPFFRTPVKLLEYSLERTPAAFAMKEFRDNLLGRNGAVARDNAWTRMTMGSAIGSYVMYQAAQDNITGAGPTNENERKIWLRTHQPYSIRVGKWWYSYGRMEPLGTLFGLAADGQRLHGEMTDKEADDFVALMVGSIGSNLSNKTWLKGPTDFVQAVFNPGRYGENYVSSMLGTVVPAGIAQYARTNDPYLREQNELIDGVKARMPGERETLNFRLDPFGEPIKTEGGLGPDLLSPVYMKAASEDFTISEMLRLHAPPGRLEKEIMGVELTPQEWTVYNEAAGKFTKTLTDALVNAPAYKQLPDEAKKGLMEDAIRKSRDPAKVVALKMFPDLALRIAQKQEQDKLMGTAQSAPVQ